MSSAGVFFSSLCLSDHVRYLIFHLLFILKDKNIYPDFPCFAGHFHHHYYFHYVYLWGYKKPPLRLRHSSMQNQLNTTHKHKSITECFLSILEQKQQLPEETMDQQKLRYIASQVTLWDYLGIPQANYLALEKNEKSRMFSGYYKNLVFKYFGGKKIYFFCCLAFFLGNVFMSGTFELFLVFLIWLF